MTEKLTKKNYYNAIFDLIDHADTDMVYGEKQIDLPSIRDFVKHEVELLNKKNTSNNVKPSKSAMETAEVAQKILNIMPMDTDYTPTEIIALSPEFAGVSNQRITSALKVLMSAGLVVNKRKGTKSVYRKVGE